jgi:hypothetical protein
MKKTIVLLVLVLLMYVPGQAQTNSSHYKAAETLMQTMNMKQILDESLNQMLAMQIKNNPSLESAEPTLKAFFGKYMSWEGLKEDYIKIYMAEFTEKELKDMNAFYKTETGKKMAARQATIAMKGAQLGQEKVQAHMSELQEMLKKTTE